LHEMTIDIPLGDSMKNAKRTLKLLPVALAAAALLAGCGGGGGGSDDSQTTNQTSTGVAVDFYLSGSTVSFANASCAPTTTNVNGEFTIPAAGCGAITVKGGVDVATGLPFKGVFTAPAGSTVVTPITTLIQSLIDSGKLPAQAQSTVMTALSLSKDPTTTDPMKDPDSLAQNLALVQVAEQTSEAFKSKPSITAANFEEVYANILKNVATTLPVNATVALDAAFVTAAAEATATAVSPGSVEASNTAKIIGPTVAEIAQSAATQIRDMKSQLEATRGVSADVLALVMTQTNIAANIKALSGLSTAMAAELQKHDLATVDPATIAAQITASLNVGGRVTPPTPR
jgi:hypothetical protein